MGFIDIADGRYKGSIEFEVGMSGEDMEENGENSAECPIFKWTSLEGYYFWK